MTTKTVHISNWRELPKVQVYVCAACGGQLEQVDPEAPASCRANPDVACAVSPAHDGIITRGRWREHGPVLEGDEVLRAYPQLREQLEGPPPTREKFEENVRLLRGDLEFEGFD